MEAALPPQPGTVACASPLLEVKELKTRFQTREGVVNAVNGVSFMLREGETLGLVGESGCGKSVSALSLMRLIRPPSGRITAGEVRFGGRDLLALSPPEMESVRGNEIAMIFQDPMTSLNPVLRIGQQIGEVLQLHKGLGRAAAREQAIALLELVGIPAARSRIDQYPHQFSGGMRQRVMIAIALSCGPKLLIADEPTTALDVTIQAQILDLLRRLRDQMRMSMIMITHDLGVVAGIADRINVMYAGYIVETGTPDQIFYDPRHPYTIGLLRSIPRLDRRRRAKLTPIEGLPPDLIDPPRGCPFQPRCRYRTDRCAAENPVLEEVEPGHLKACWVPIDGAEHGVAAPASLSGEGRS